MSDLRMPLFISTTPPAPRWGEEGLLSANDSGVTIHIATPDREKALRQAGRQLDTQGIRSVSLAGPGWDLANCWPFWQGFRSAKSGQQVEWPALSLAEKHELELRLQVVDWVRDLSNAPAEDLAPQQLARQATALLEKFASPHIKATVIEGEALLYHGYHGIHAVGRGSARPPLLLCVDYNPSGDPEAPVMLCLVGKGITYDSGGYSLKASEAMDSMKSDMGGAALATGSLSLAIARGMKQRVKLYLCCAENMVSGSSYKLGDIIRYRNGKSVEVMNTDAEGRLVLADGLIEASAQSPRWLIDCATLTGAAKTAVGADYHALFSFDDAMLKDFLAVAAAEGEPFWPLPLAELHRHQMVSPFADLSNIAPSGGEGAPASSAAGFLSYFVSNYQSGWLHIDCSASYRKRATAQWAAGGTAIGVLTLGEVLLRLGSDPQVGSGSLN